MVFPFSFLIYLIRCPFISRTQHFRKRRAVTQEELLARLSTPSRNNEFNPICVHGIGCFITPLCVWSLCINHHLEARRKLLESLEVKAVCKVVEGFVVYCSGLEAELTCILFFFFSLQHNQPWLQKQKCISCCRKRIYIFPTRSK